MIVGTNSLLSFVSSQSPGGRVFKAVGTAKENAPSQEMESPVYGIAKKPDTGSKATCWGVGCKNTGKIGGN